MIYITCTHTHKYVFVNKDTPIIVNQTVFSKPQISNNSCCRKKYEMTHFYHEILFNKTNFKINKKANKKFCISHR